MITGPETTAVVVLACKGEIVGKVVNGRYLVRLCRKRRCDVAGEHTFHIFDLMTGRSWDSATDPIERGTPAGGNQSCQYSAKFPRD